MNYKQQLYANIRRAKNEERKEELRVLVDLTLDLHTNYGMDSKDWFMELSKRLEVFE